MKSYEICITIAASIIVALLVFVVFTLPPMDQYYQDCLEQVSSYTGIEQEARILERYPELKIAKSNCNAVKSLRTEIEMRRGGPTPNVSKEHSEMIKQKESQIKKLRQQNDHILSLVEGKITDLP